MNGGLYRSANAARGDDRPVEDVAMPATPQADLDWTRPVSDSAGPDSAGPDSAGPDSAGPDSTSPGSAGPDSTRVDLAAVDPPGMDSTGIEPPTIGASATAASAVPPSVPPSGAPVEEPDDAAGNSAIMAVGSLVSRLTGFLRTAIIAAALGGFLVGDAYTTAQYFPGMIYELLLGGILTSVVIPVLVRRRKSDADRGEAYTQRLVTLTVVTLGVATTLAVVAAPWVSVLYAGDEHTDSYRALLTALSYLMLPIIFFSGVSALLSAVLNTRGHFAAPMWTPILNNLVVIATAGLYIALFGAKLIEPEAMTPGRILVIGGGTLLGIVVQTVGLWPALRKVGYRWRWRFDFRALGLRELGRLGAWVFCYVAVSQVGVFVVLRLLNSANAAGKNAGPIIYTNVYLLMMMAHGVVAVSIITALMPRMSAAAAEGRHADVAADLSRGSRMAAAILAPIAVCYGVLAQPIPVVLFQNGAFTPENSLATSLVLLMAALALVPFAISQLFTFALYALTDPKAAAMINIPVVLLRIAVQVGLFLWLAPRFVAAGLMVGNAVSYLLAVGLTAVFLRSRIGVLGGRQMAASFGRVLAAAAAAGVAGLVAVNLVLGGAPQTTRPHNLVALLVGGMVVCGVYGGAALLLRVREVTDVVAMVRRRLGR